MSMILLAAGLYLQLVAQIDKMNIIWLVILCIIIWLFISR